MTNTIATKPLQPLLQPQINKLARKDKELIKKLSEYTGKHPGTVGRWFYTDDINTLRVDILNIMADHFGKESIYDLLLNP